MSKKWIVSVPFTGYYTVEVIAETEEEAISKGVKADTSLELSSEDEVQGCLQEWSTHTRIVKGNHFTGVMNEAEAEEIEAEEDE